jgi:hypothetical protein
MIRSCCCNTWHGRPARVLTVTLNYKDHITSKNEYSVR